MKIATETKHDGNNEDLGMYVPWLLVKKNIQKRGNKGSGIDGITKTTTLERENVYKKTQGSRFNMLSTAHEHLVDKPRMETIKPKKAKTGKVEGEWPQNKTRRDLDLSPKANKRRVRGVKRNMKLEEDK